MAEGLGDVYARMTEMVDGAEEAVRNLCIIVLVPQGVCWGEGGFMHIYALADCAMACGVFGPTKRVMKSRKQEWLAGGGGHLLIGRALKRRRRGSVQHFRWLLGLLKA